MNVRQLIEELQKQDQDMEVYFSPETCGCLGDCPVEVVKEHDMMFYSYDGSEGGYLTKKVVMLEDAAYEY